jgi:regulator of nonsense transcripts 1
VGYIPDDVSSVHSGSVGGVNLPSNFPSMFVNFTDQWPGLPGRANGKAKRNAPSIAGESVAASELTDLNGSSVVDGKTGGVSLAGLAIRDMPPLSNTTSDRLKRYVEGEKENGGYSGKDDDNRSVSTTSFASQIAPSGFD